jgi:hypothetical protein
LVRVTTDDGSWPDHDCILTPADWNELEHDSTVAYSTCKFGPAVKALEAAIERGLFQEISSPSVAVLRKVILAAHTSAGMPPTAKKLLGQI